MNDKIIVSIQEDMNPYLNPVQRTMLSKVLVKSFKNVEVLRNTIEFSEDFESENNRLFSTFLSAKRVEGCSEKTLEYYEATIRKMLNTISKRIDYITTDDLRMEKV